jgi:hypothetical protein
MKLGISVLLGLIVSFGVLSSSEDAVNAQVVEDPVLVGTGDIARCSATGDEATANLLDGISGTVFTIGDNAYQSGTATEFSKCYEPSWGRHKTRTKPAVGNHEYYTEGAKPYYDYFGLAAGDPTKGYYSYDIGSWHMIVLNSNCAALVADGCAAGSPQEQWLKDDLATHSNACTLAYWHHPRFSSGSHGGDASVGPFWSDLYQAGTDVVLNGHDHDYERFAPQNPLGISDPSQGIREFVVGTGGAALTGFKTPMQPNSEFGLINTNGVLKLTLHPDSYDWQFITAPGGAVADSGIGQCHGAPDPSSIDATAPAVQPPSQDLPTGSTLGTSTIPTKVSWSAADDQSGVARYELQQSTDGGVSFANVKLPSATSTTKTLQLQPGTTYQFRVRATDGAGNTSDWTPGPAFLVDPHQENSDSNLVYAGSWTQQALSSAYGGGVKYASAKGSAAQFTFSGQTVAWISTKGPNMGKATVAIDGVVIKTLDLYASTTQTRKVVYSQSGLDPAVSHTVTVQATGSKRSASSGTRVDVDAFVTLH